MRYSANSLILLTLGVASSVSAMKHHSNQHKLATLKQGGFFENFSFFGRKEDNSTSSSSSSSAVAPGLPSLDDIYKHIDDEDAVLPPVEFLTQDGLFTFPADFFDQFSPVSNPEDFPEAFLDGENNIVFPQEFYDAFGNITITPEMIAAYTSDSEHTGLGDLIKNLTSSGLYTPFPPHPDSGGLFDFLFGHQDNSSDEGGEVRVQVSDKDEGSFWDFLDFFNFFKKAHPGVEKVQKTLEDLGITNLSEVILPPLEFLKEDGNFTIPASFFDNVAANNSDGFPPDFLDDDGSITIPEEYIIDGNLTLPLLEIVGLLNDEEYPRPGELMEKFIEDHGLERLFGEQEKGGKHGHEGGNSTGGGNNTDGENKTHGKNGSHGQNGSHSGNHSSGNSSHRNNSGESGRNNQSHSGEHGNSSEGNHGGNGGDQGSQDGRNQTSSSSSHEQEGNSENQGNNSEQEENGRQEGGNHQEGEGNQQEGQESQNENEEENNQTE